MKDVFVIATHPDDEVLGCGGVIARHSATGDRVTIVIVTRGAEDVFSREFVEQVREELRMAGQVLGVASIRFLDFPAPRLDIVPGYQLADGLSRVIREVQPDTIYLPHRGDIHADHQAVYQATLVAVRPVTPLKVRRLLVYETLSETEWAPPTGDMAFVPTVFVDISDYLDVKLNAMRCYQSQLKEFPNSRSLEAIQALARLRGATANLVAAEAFMLVREIVT